MTVPSANLVESVRRIVSSAPARRTSQEELEAQAPEIADILLGARRLHDWNLRHRHEPRVVVGEVRTRKGTRYIFVEEAAALMPTITALRAEVHRARRNWSKLPRNASLQRVAKAHARYFFAR